MNQIELKTKEQAKERHQTEFKTKEQVKEELKQLLLEIKKALPKEGTLRDILMNKSDDIRVYLDKWKSLDEIKIEDVTIKIFREVQYLIDVDIDIERAITYSFVLVCDEILAVNEKNAGVAVLEIKNLKLREL